MTILDRISVGKNPRPTTPAEQREQCPGYGVIYGCEQWTVDGRYCAVCAVKIAALHERMKETRFGG